MDQNLKRDIKRDSTYLHYAAAYTFSRKQDFTSTAKAFPEGIVICHPQLIAGYGHVNSVLMQASSYWQRNQQIAKNKSIDLLMRFTCQRQISDAVRASSISDTDSLAILGLVESEGDIDMAVGLLRKVAGDIERNDSLLLLDDSKENFLKSFHGLPKWLSKDQLIAALKEKAVLLVFSK